MSLAESPILRLDLVRHKKAERTNGIRYDESWEYELCYPDGTVVDFDTFTRASELRLFPAQTHIRCGVLDVRTHTYSRPKVISFHKLSLRERRIFIGNTNSQQRVPLAQHVFLKKLSKI